MKEMAQQNRETALFLPEDNNQYGPAKSAIEMSRNRQLKFQEQGLMYYFVLLDATVSVLVDRVKSHNLSTGLNVQNRIPWMKFQDTMRFIMKRIQCST